jgi:hypothetical protein
MRSAHLAKPMLALAVLTFAAACERDVEVHWTLEGQAAESACDDAVGNEVRVVSVTQVNDEETREATVNAPCADGTAVVTAGRVATVEVELLRGGEAVGTSGKIAVDEGDDSPVVNADVHVTRGLLTAELTVLGDSCGDVSGASSFDVVLLRERSGLDNEEVDSSTVSCDDGKAMYENDDVQVGARYYLSASATIGGDAYATGGLGVTIQINAPRVFETVDLRRDERPPQRDGGPNITRDGGGPADGGYDAGMTDSGTADSGTADSGTMDSGTMDSGTTDSGYDGGYDGGYDAGYDAGYDGGYDAGYDGGYDAGDAN